ncbi:MAG: hypothetical protein AAFQ58_05050 [Pseudomonadota bacterium]
MRNTCRARRAAAFGPMGERDGASQRWTATDLWAASDRRNTYLAHLGTGRIAPTELNFGANDAPMQ